MRDWLYLALTNIYYRLRYMVDHPCAYWIENRIFFLYTRDDEEPRLWRLPWAI